MTAIMTFRTMGNGRDFLEGKRYGINSEYVRVGKSLSLNGIVGTIVKQRSAQGHHTNLPKYSGNSDIYFRQNENGVCQARVFEDHKQKLDLDWSHSHQNRTGNKEKFKAGTVHVQEWIENKDGSFRRASNEARYMSKAEIEKYGPLIKKVCPEVKFLQE